MRSFAGRMSFLWLGVCLVLSSGCHPFSRADADEETEPNFLSGKRKLANYDFVGALAAFERAIEVNPRSAAAHLELGLLYYKHFTDYPAAIYHLEKMLHYRPDHPLANQIREQIESCKLDLAAEVKLPPVNHRTEAELKRLIQENTVLTNRVSGLRLELAKLQALIQAREATVKAEPPPPDPAEKRESSSPPNPPRKRPDVRPSPSRIVEIARASIRTQRPPGKSFAKHIIRSGDNFFRLGKRYRIDPKRIQAANPGVDPRSLKIGQVINLPR